MVAVAILLMTLGGYQAEHVAVDALPEYGPVQVQLQTEAVGLSATEVEQFITVPMEDELNGIAYLDQIHSRSIPGLSAIDLTFKPGTDLLRARQLVAERLSQGPGVANVAAPPVMIQPISSTGRVMLIALSSTDISLIDLSTLARWKLRPRLLGVPGVASVAIWGQRDRQLQVQVDPATLHADGVTLTQIIDTTGNALWSSPLTFVEASTPGSDGFIDTPGQRLAVQHVLPINSAADLARVTVEETGSRIVHLGDVTSVVEDHQPLVGDAVVGDAPGLLLVVDELPGADTLQVTRGLQAALDAMRPGLGGVTVDTTVFQPDTFIDTSLRDVGLAAALGLFLLILLLGLLLRGWGALVVATSVGSSIVGAAYVLYLFGVTFNAFVLAGLAVGVGVVVDEAVGTVLTLKRAIRERRQRDDGDEIGSVIAEACAALRGPLAYATVIGVLATLPIALLAGLAGRFAWPVVLAYLSAVGTALVIALLVTPALSSLLLRGAAGARATGPRATGSGRAVRWVLGRTGPAYVIVGILVLGALAVVPQLGNHPVLPQLRDRNLVVDWSSAVGTSLPQMDALTTELSQQLRAISGVHTVVGEVGRAVGSDQVVDVNAGQLWLTLDPTAPYDATVAAVRQVVAASPAASGTVSTYSDLRLRETQAQSPQTPITVRVFGPDFSTLTSQADGVRDTLATIPGVVDSNVAIAPTQPGIEVTVDLASAEKYGLTPGEVRRQATTLINGLPAGSLYQNQQVFDVVVVGQKSVRSDLSSVADLLIDTPNGDQVRLGDLATVAIAPQPSVIDHENASRYLDVTANVRGRDLNAVLADVRTRVAAMSFPTAVHAEVSSPLADQQNAVQRMWGLLVGVAIVMFLLLQAAFHSWRRAALLLALVPLALVGGVAAAPLTGGVETLGAMLGLLLLFGLAIRHGVLLVRDYQRLEQVGGEVSGVDVVLAVTRDRAGTILTSLLGTAVLLAPFVALRDRAGGEVLAPLATVALGGLATSALVMLYLLPALYARILPRDRARPAEPPPVGSPPIAPGPVEPPSVAPRPPGSDDVTGIPRPRPGTSDEQLVPVLSAATEEAPTVPSITQKPAVVSSSGVEPPTLPLGVQPDPA
jgi:Cu/Ag efflux pump CusA